VNVQNQTSIECWRGYEVAPIVPKKRPRLRSLSDVCLYALVFLFGGRFIVLAEFISVVRQGIRRRLQRYLAQVYRLG